MKRYLYTKPGGGGQGSYDEAGLRQLLAEGTIGPDTLITQEGTSVEKPLAETIDLTKSGSLGPTAERSSAPPPATRLALFSNWAAVLLAAAILGGACIIAYRPGSSDPVSHFQHFAAQKKAELERLNDKLNFSRKGGLNQYTFDVRRTGNSEINHDAEIECSWGLATETDSGEEPMHVRVHADYKYREGAWRMVELVIYGDADKLKNAEPYKLLVKEIHKVLDPNGNLGMPKFEKG